MLVGFMEYLPGNCYERRVGAVIDDAKAKMLCIFVMPVIRGKNRLSMLSTSEIGHWWISKYVPIFRLENWQDSGFE